MSSTQIVGGLSSAITILIAFVLFYWVWQQYVIDSTRQQLFELRDELFDLATKYQIDRGGSAYQVLRETLNTTIRFAHDLDLLSLLVTFVTIKAIRVKNAALLAKHLEEIMCSVPHPEAKKRIESIIERRNRILLWHIFRRSLLLWILVPLSVFISIFVFVSTDFFSRAKKKLVLIISAAVSYSEAGTPGTTKISSRLQT